MDIDLKTKLILDFFELTKSDNKNYSNLLFVTSLGVISGHLITDEDDNSLKHLKNLSKNCIEDFYSQNNLTQNDIFFNLKDVTIKNGNNIIKLPFIIIFSNQIIGISII